MAASSSTRKITSPFHNRNPSSPFSSSSSSSSLKQLIHRSSSSSSSSYYASSGNGYGSRSTTSVAVRSDSMYGGYGGRSLVGEPDGSMLKSGGGDSISVTVRFRPLSERFRDR
ncbi:hypothetical protein Hdeb2414_s0136g00808671 [Helianthus debilis subsp. tardiflorus]